MFIEIFKIRSLRCRMSYDQLRSTTFVKASSPIILLLTQQLLFRYIYFFTNKPKKKKKKNLLNSLLYTRSKIKRIIRRFEKHVLHLYQLSLIYTPFNAILLSSRIYYNHFRAKRLCSTTIFIQLSLSLHIYICSSTCTRGNHPLVFNKVSYQPVQASSSSSSSSISSSNTHHDISNRGTIALPSSLLTLFPSRDGGDLPLFNCASLYICNDGSNLFRSFALGTKKS